MIGERIRKKRKYLKWTQKVLAQKVGLKGIDISRIETGRLKKPPSEELLGEIAEALGENVSYLFEEPEKRIVSSLNHFQNLPLVNISLQIEPKHIKIVVKAIKRLVKELRKEKTNGRAVRRKKLF